MTRGLISSALVVALVLAGPALAQQTPPITPKQVFAEDRYLSAMLTKLGKYRYPVDGPAKEGTVVVRVLIARDGRLLDAWVLRSSGIPAMDTALIVALRQGSPYGPLPPEIPGSTISLRLPVLMTAD